MAIRTRVTNRLLLVIVTVPLGVFALSGFDFSRHLVPPQQILNGGPPKDGIPAILNPSFVSASAAGYLRPRDRVIGVVIKGHARAYPIRILNWHEVVDDSAVGVPFAVTFCPLTHSAIVYERRLGSTSLTLAVSGKLYQSNLLFYDKSTESLWSQIEGKAIAGPLTGRQLSPLPSVVTTWSAWRHAHPDTLVLSIITGYSRDYAVDPYLGYERSSELMFPVSSSDDRLTSKAFVLGVTVGSRSEAFPFTSLAETRSPVRVQLAGASLTVTFDSATQTARASISGEPVAAYTGYWFAWAAFHPGTLVWGRH